MSSMSVSISWFTATVRSLSHSLVVNIIILTTYITDLHLKKPWFLLRSGLIVLVSSALMLFTPPLRRHSFISLWIVPFPSVFYPANIEWAFTKCKYQRWKRHWFCFHRTDIYLQHLLLVGLTQVFSKCNTFSLALTPLFFHGLILLFPLHKLISAAECLSTSPIPSFH